LGKILDSLLPLIDLLLHVDKTLGVVIQDYGTWVYGILSGIVFAETGLVIAPFLPGDSLLFIAGAFCATGSLHAGLLIGLLFISAVLGNTVNYWIGSLIGHRIYEANWRLIDKDALRKTHGFYEKHGGKTIVIARFLPIVRTFAPFVAGISEMTFAKFQLFNIIGAILWVAGLVLAGYFFGNLPFVRQYLNVIVLAGIGAAIVPLIFAGLFKMFRSKK
jgi:membrane-associated protein